MVIPPVNKVPALYSCLLQLLLALGARTCHPLPLLLIGGGFALLSPKPPSIYTPLELNKVAIYSLVNEQVSCVFVLQPLGY